MMKKNWLFLNFAIILCCSCSLKYAQTPNVEDEIPEFVFEGTKMTSYEKSAKKTEIQAEVLEQYKNSSQSYAKGIEFSAYDDDGKISSEGSCGYLFADTKKEIYQLYENINVYNHSDNTKFSSDALKWNGKSEQLTSGKSDSVKIEKDNTVIVGSGFSASGVSKTYKFTGAVSGTITDSDENSENLEEK